MEKIPDKIMVVTITDYRNYPDSFWKPLLKKNCKNLIWFDLKKSYFNKGKNKTKENILKIAEKEKPDYLFMFDSLYYDLDIIELLIKIEKLSPQTRKIFFSGDDDIRFNTVRYLALFFDYVIATQNDFIKNYKNDGLKNIIFYISLISNKNVEITKEKRYDVSFVGTSKADRNEIIEYLHKNGVKIALFGTNWENYPELKEVHVKDFLSKDYPKIIDQTRVNLCLSKNMMNVPHLKGKFFEVSLRKAFGLVEYSPQLKALFEENKEIIFFRGKEDLLKKIDYYLRNEKEREKIAQNAYKKVKLNFDSEKEFKKIITKTFKKKETLKQFKISPSIIDINEKSINLPKEDIIKKIKDYNCVSFSKGKVKKSEFKDYLQVYSLQKNKKEISCCDYYIHSKDLGNYAQFRYIPFGLDPAKEYKKFLNINQIVMAKEFFIKNFEKIKKSYKTELIDFVDNKNTAFISIPLVSISKFRKDFFDDPEFSRELGFFLFFAQRELYSRRKNPLKFLKFLCVLIKETLSGKRFIFDQLKMKFQY